MVHTGVAFGEEWRNRPTEALPLLKEESERIRAAALDLASTLLSVGFDTLHISKRMGSSMDYNQNGAHRRGLWRGKLL
jgi:hypothetical protein